MRVAIVGATGNVGTSVLRSLIADPQIESIVGIARRRPSIELDKVEWAPADVVHSDLVPLLRGADAVVHLAWLIQPSRDRSVTKAVNQDGSRRVFAATAEAGVPSLVYASSVGAYSPGPKEYAVDETWPTRGIPTSFYSVDKAATERMLDSFEEEHPDIRVVRLRPGLIFKREAGAEVRRLFAGPFLPTTLVRPSFVKIVPDIPGLRLQCVHSYDVAEAYRLAITSDERGAFNVAADPVLDPPTLGEMFGARLVKVSPRVVRGFARATWKARLQPTPEGWVDLALQSPLLDTKRARADLGWEPAYTSKQALLDLMTGLRTNYGIDTPPLHPRSGGPFRIREIATGVGGRV
ncbi:MAG: NAD-dependent epimerase/dehydratase family protein [Actinobacteria bacterium]|nr:NAD-dependent epimerase/dehydratase family protein [Actinomycetota bacterium]